MKADDAKQGALDECPGKQGGDRGRRLTVSVGEPHVDRGQAGFGPVAHHHEDEGDTDDARIELGGDGRDAGIIHGPGENPALCVHGRAVHQHRAEQAEGNADGGDDDVLPRRLQAVLVAVEAHQQGRGDGGALHRDPQDAKIVGQHRDQHGGDEPVDQGVVVAQPIGAHLSTREFLAHPAHRGHRHRHGEQTDEQ